MLIDVLLIDPKEMKITKHQIKQDDIDMINSLIGSRTFTVGGYLPNDDAIYVDDEGLLMQPEEGEPGLPAFSIEGIDGVLVGKGLVIGSNLDTGESISCKSNHFDFVNKLKFGFVEPL